MLEEIQDGVQDRGEELETALDRAHKYELVLQVSGTSLLIIFFFAIYFFNISPIPRCTLCIFDITPLTAIQMGWLSFSNHLPI